tara:strand:+ start:2348 stop:2887 length:540 start_codon:yes stop_codon:yes gene_type:complete
MSEFDKKLWEIKAKLPKFKKATKGFKFKYTNLSDIEKGLKPLLLENRIGYAHSIDVDGGKNVLVTTIFDLDSGASQKHRLVIPEAVKLAGMNDYQSLGSALTYFRRYHLVVAFGILTDEDVDAIQEPIPQAVVNHVEKIKQLIKIGRAKTTLEKYYTTYKPKMSPAQMTDIEELIKNIK